MNIKFKEELSMNKGYLTGTNETSKCTGMVGVPDNQNELTLTTIPEPNTITFCSADGWLLKMIDTGEIIFNNEVQMSADEFAEEFIKIVRENTSFKGKKFEANNLKEANDNIKLLISTIVNMKRAKVPDECCDPETSHSDMCDGESDCEKCKDEYYENMRKYYESDYLIKDNN